VRRRSRPLTAPARRPRLCRVVLPIVVLGTLAGSCATAHDEGAATAPPTNAPSTPEQRQEALDEATTPIPIRTQLAFKPSYTFPHGSDRYTAELQFSPILPYAGTWIPTLEVPGVWSLARFQISGESLENSDGSFSGLTDLKVVDLAALRAGPLDVGAGFATVFPMATTPELGQGKWQVGPAVGARLGTLAPLKIAVLVQNLYSVAGSSQSPNLAYVIVQPFVTLDLPADLFLSSNAEMDFYWRGGKSTVPVDLGFGRAFSDRFVGSVEFWYTVADNDRGDIKVRAVINFVH
jgi:hypothetical protein